MIVLVTGGRNFANEAQVHRVLDEVLSWSPTGRIKIVTGGATGADLWAKLWAKERGQEYVEYPVAHDKVSAVAMGALFDWETHGHAAGPFRNQHMLDREKPDQGVVFDGENGTIDMLTKLFARGVNTWVVGKDA